MFNCLQSFALLPNRRLNVRQQNDETSNPWLPVDINPYNQGASKAAIESYEGDITRDEVESSGRFPISYVRI